MPYSKAHWLMLALLPVMWVASYRSLSGLGPWRRWFALALLGTNLFAYAVLTLLLVCRIAVYPRRVLSDFCDHGKGAGFFTVVAGTCVLGSQVLVVAKEASPARVLWMLGIGSVLFFGSALLFRRRLSAQVLPCFLGRRRYNLLPTSRIED